MYVAARKEGCEKRKRGDSLGLVFASAGICDVRGRVWLEMSRFHWQVAPGKTGDPRARSEDRTRKTWLQETGQGDAKTLSRQLGSGLGSMPCRGR